jgi:hypothetical protein
MSEYKPWGKYIFAPKSGCVFDHSCLTDIADFMVARGAARTETLKKQESFRLSVDKMIDEM